MEFINMPNRPQSGRMQDSFMSDANGNVGPIGDGQMRHAQEEAKRIKGQMSEDMDDSFHTSDGSSSFSKEDVSEETHQFESESEETVLSSESSEEPDMTD